jgi:DNA-directed RNA polymerase subunit M/transcription elongation factor TFIIS
MPPKKITKSKDESEIKNQIIQIIVLSSKGDIKKGKLNTENGNLNIEIIKTYLRKKSTPEVIGSYVYEKYILTLIGYKEGKPGTENKHELPEPYNENVLYGDVIIIASDGGDWLNNSCSFTPEQFDKFIISINEDNDDSDDNISDDNEEEAEDEEDINIDEVDDDIVEDEIEEEVVEDEIIPKKKEVKKKKATQANSGYEKQQKLLHQQNFKELLIDSPKNTIRDKCVERFMFLTDSGYSKADIIDLEYNIYKAAHNDADKKRVIKHWDNTMFKDIYNMIQLLIVHNIHPKSPVNNPRLLNRIKEGELKLGEIPYLSPQEMYPENWQELSDRQLIREQKLLEGDKGSATDKFKCHRCGKRECTYYEMQTRSADEPMTIFISCLNCGKRWRQ